MTSSTSLAVRLAVILSALFSRATHANSAISYPGWSKFSGAARHQNTASRRRGGPFLSGSSKHVNVLLAARKTTPKGKKKPKKEEEEASVAIREPNVLEQVVFGSFMIAGTTAVEYASGFIGAYFLGTLSGIPSLVYSKEGLAMGQRFSNMTAKSSSWAKSWAPISAVFGGCDAATRVIRGNKTDQWNTIISSAAAGACFSRQGGPAAMIRGATVYGGFAWVLSGGLFKQRQFQYKEEAVEF